MMIDLFIQSYFNILLSVGLAAIVFFAIGLFFILRSFKSSKVIVNKPISIMETKEEVNSVINSPSNIAPITITPKDFNAIAGDDVFATQLDLARAYIESGKKNMAKKILESVIKQGSATQQGEAQQLLNLVVS